MNNKNQLQKIRELLNAPNQSLTELEELVENVRHMPSIAGMGLVRGFDEPAFREALADLRERLPHALEQACELLDDREKILSSAQKQAARMIEDAQKQAASYVENSELVAQTERRAAEISEATVRRRQEAIQETMVTINSSYGKAEAGLKKLLDGVREERKKFQGNDGS